LRAAVEAVVDPEMSGVTIGQLGMVLAARITADEAEIDLGPTFLGCVAVGLIVLDIEGTAVKSDPSLTRCRVNTVHNTWSPDRISDEGTAQLRELGIVVVRSDQRLDEVACPFCSTAGLEPRGGAGPTRCRTVAWCTACRNVVEAMGSGAAANEGAHTYVHV
jgi:ring-1,2-phenylacetyl-CoA epoxidase subunit PaaD